MLLLLKMRLLGSISSTFYKQLLGQYSFAKKTQTQTVIKEKLRNTFAYKKAAQKTLMKLTPEVPKFWRIWLD